jgi:hypothetical protein
MEKSGKGNLIFVNIRGVDVKNQGILTCSMRYLFGIKI